MKSTFIWFFVCFFSDNSTYVSLVITQLIRQWLVLRCKSIHSDNGLWHYMTYLAHKELTHLPLVPHICINELSHHWVMIFSGNSLSPVRHPAITWRKDDDVLSIGPVGTTLKELRIKIRKFHSWKCIWKCLYICICMPILPLTHVTQDSWKAATGLRHHGGCWCRGAK